MQAQANLVWTLAVLLVTAWRFRAEVMGEVTWVGGLSLEQRDFFVTGVCRLGSWVGMPFVAVVETVCGAGRVIWPALTYDLGFSRD